MEQKYTTLAQEALGDAVQSASAAGNPQVEPLHLLDSLLRQENGVIGGLIEAVGANRQTIGAQVRNALVSLPSASGSSTAQGFGQPPADHRVGRRQQGNEGHGR